jgi:hypothetical protein
MLTENESWLDFSNHTYNQNRPGRPGRCSTPSLFRNNSNFLPGVEGNRWDSFIQTGNVEAREVTESLESIHDSFHDNIGGSGFMNNPAIAGAYQ